MPNGMASPYVTATSSTILVLTVTELNSGFDCYPEAQEQILRFVREHRDLTRRSWAKRADRIKVETLMKGRGLFYLIYTLAEMKNNHAV